MTKITFGILALIALVAAPAAAAPMPPAVQQALREARKDCAPNRFEPEKGFVTEQDVNGDQVKDFILDYSAAGCSGMASGFCGTGGCFTQIFASLPTGRYVKAFEDQVRTYEFKQLNGRPALVLDFHGTRCGLGGNEACPKTFYRQGGRFTK